MATSLRSMFRASLASRSANWTLHMRRIRGVRIRTNANWGKTRATASPPPASTPWDRTSAKSSKGSSPSTRRREVMSTSASKPGPATTKRGASIRSGHSNAPAMSASQGRPTPLLQGARAYPSRSSKHLHRSSAWQASHSRRSRSCKYSTSKASWLRPRGARPRRWCQWYCSRRSGWCRVLPEKSARISCSETRPRPRRKALPSSQIWRFTLLALATTSCGFSFQAPGLSCLSRRQPSTFPLARRRSLSRTSNPPSPEPRSTISRSSLS
mmetsp:Transcript_56419/g.133951  ORF Transcript_56419/g.133951 Transcript_56419/m.133951 type:complete len:269 (+) Transcript_56419:3176-3982(+)